MKAIIVGGGIGGLTTALMLHARGLDCEIYEQTDTVRELGVGINTLPHAIKELAGLGLLDRLDQVAIRTYELFYTNRFGQEIWREPRGTDAGFDCAAVLDPSRPLAGRDLSGGARAARRVENIHRPSPRRVHAGRRRRHRLFLRSQRLASRNRARRHPDRRRRHSFQGARAAFSERRGPRAGTAPMLWRGALDWPKFLTGRSMVIAGGMAGKARALSDRRRLARRSLPDQLGGDGESRRRRRHRRTRKTGRGPAASRI